MKKRLLGLLIIILPLVSQQSLAESRFSEVWDLLKEEPYEKLPQYKVTLPGMTSFNPFRRPMFRNDLVHRSFATIRDNRDVRPYFRKPLHPNGICLSGTWNITKSNPYSGYFKAGSKARVIARASTVRSETKRHQKRAFSMAIKLYPTMDENHPYPLETANIFTSEDVEGTVRDYFLDSIHTNDLEGADRPTPDTVENALIGLGAITAFALADDSNTSTAKIRELYPVSELGLEEWEESRTPTWIKIQGSEDTPRIIQDDFRDELDMEHYPDGITMNISVANKGERGGLKLWQEIGYLHFDESVASVGCDHRLHFQHPQSREIHN